MKTLQLLAIALSAVGAVGYGLPASGQIPAVEPIPNRYLAFGDSITYGGYVDEPYPSRLEDKLDLRVALSEIINSGNPGEGTLGGSERITDQVSEYRPQYVLIMEGTNDVTNENLPSDVYNHLLDMIDNARETAGVEDVQVMLATLPPRLDYLNDATAEMNQQAIIPAAQARNVPVCDQWTAFTSLPYWQSLYRDDKHPNEVGLQLIADTFYGCMLAGFPDFEEENTPPTAWIESLPPSVECGAPVLVGWNGEDDLNWVMDYDVQAQVAGGAWTDWLLATQQTGGVHPGGGRYGDSLGFRVRARDLIGNQGDYGDAVYTPIADNVPPDEAHLDPLPAIELVPFPVSWWGSDACADVVAYDVQYKVGAVGAWQPWLVVTPSTSGSFDPASPQSGEIYYFRVRAQDAAGNWSDWSDAEASTILARFGLTGNVYNVRHQPVAAAEINLDPAPLWIDPQPGGGFFAYLAAGGDYDLTAARDDLYSPLPTMRDLPVDDHVSGLEFVLPSQDDAVTDGDFEAGNLGTWQISGSSPPTLTVEAHTGLGAVELGGLGQDSHLTQVVSPAPAISDPALSFMARLAAAGPASVLEVELSNSGILSPAVTYTLPLDSVAWSHTWFDLGWLVGEPLTLTFHVSDSAAVLLDEICLGSSLRGGYLFHLPIVLKNRARSQP